ncbi:MAG TPA: hypothetical protein VH596_16860 [Terriglobales bacterium]
MADSQSTASSIQNFSGLGIAVEPARTTQAEELAKSDLWIFREGRRDVPGATFLNDLRQRLSSRNGSVDCLIQAGELETALADSGSLSASTAASLTNCLADRLYAAKCGNGQDPEDILNHIEPSASITISPPEGFTYYALHPLDFARVAERIADEIPVYAVIGIRSIGTTLSAVVVAALNKRGNSATRITVRPKGHPYSREMQLLATEKEWIADQISKTAHFLIVDEGPGRSGSTFLSVAEALCHQGVSPERITIIGSRQFDPESLCAEGAPARWRKFRFLAASSSMNERFSRWTYLGGGDWRMYFCGSEQNWPESWTQMERFKVLSPDRREVVKFEGMGRIGEEARHRAFVLAGAGFSPAVHDAGNGFLSYATIASGKHLQKSDLSTAILEQIARYYAFRNAEFHHSSPANPELEHMVTFNVQQEFGRELKLEAGALSSANTVVVDGRVQPYEWIVAEDGKLLKMDAISHGDNHFFPGPCNIAWDLAGTMVEWELDRQASEFLLNAFRKLSGIDLSSELNAYLLSYCVFRLGFCKMARSTVLGSREELRLDSAYHRYRSAAEAILRSF